MIAVCVLCIGLCLRIRRPLLLFRRGTITRMGIGMHRHHRAGQENGKQHIFNYEGLH